MRLAALAKLEEALDKRRGADVPVVERFTISHLPGFDDVDISPGVATLAICGGTGAGKTAIIELLNHALSGTPDVDPRIDLARLSGVDIAIQIAAPPGTFNRAISVGAVFAPAAYAAGSTIVRISDRTDLPVSVFRNPNVDLETLLDGVDSYAFEPEVREMLGSVCRREYSEIDIFEVEVGGDTIVPYFKVTSGGYSYDSRSMATGELSSFYLAWKARTAQPCSFLLVEEPEAFLPPSTHRQMFGLLASWVVKSKLGFVVTTHSPEIASRLSKRHLFPLKQTAGQARILSTADSKERVLYNLGLQPQNSVFLLVEDDLARSVLEEILGQSQLSMHARLEVRSLGGFGPVKAALTGLPDLGVRTPMLGIFDGDVEEASQAWGIPQLFTFLPFEHSMETEFLDSIRAKQGKFASLVKRSTTRLTDALEASQGQEAHDGFRTLLEQLSLSLESGAKASLYVWLTRAGNKAKLRRFLNRLSSKIGLPSV